MNKTTKGALAASAAAVLLLGGAGSLAYWSDSATVDGGTFNSGYLTLDTAAPCSAWTHVAGGAVTNIAPGDSVTKTCTFTVGAEGDNLEATPTVPDSLDVTVPVGAASFDADVAATYKLGTVDFTAADTVTEDNDGEVLTAKIVVSFPRGNATTINANDTQNITAELDDLTVALTQS